MPQEIHPSRPRSGTTAQRHLQIIPSKTMTAIFVSKAARKKSLAVTAAKQWSRYSKLISKTRRAAQPAIELSVWRLIGQSEQDLRQAKQKEEEEEPPRGSAAPSSHPKIQHNKNSHGTRLWSRRSWNPRRSKRFQQRRERKRRQKELDRHKRRDNFFRNSFIQKTNSFKQKLLSEHGFLAENLPCIPTNFTSCIYASNMAVHNLCTDSSSIPHGYVLSRQNSVSNAATQPTTI